MKPELLADYKEHYKPIEDALDKRNLKRWVVCWINFLWLFLMPVSILFFVIPIAAACITLTLNIRDIHKTYGGIIEDLNRRFPSATVTTSETTGEKKEE